MSPEKGNQIIKIPNESWRSLPIKNNPGGREMTMRQNDHKKLDTTTNNLYHSKISQNEEYNTSTSSAQVITLIRKVSGRRTLGVAFTLVLLILSCIIDCGTGFTGSSNSLRNPNAFDDRVHGNHIRRRGVKPPNIINYNPNNLTTNLTTLIQQVGSKCNLFCDDQAQYNGICVEKGCLEWKTGLNDGCSSVCNGTDANYREVYACQIGCSRAVEEYYFRVTGLMGVPDPPTLISAAKSSSLRLSWEGSGLPLPYLAYAIQRRFYNRPNQWETIPSSSQHVLNQTSVTVQKLKPFTEYQFRVGWILAHDFPPYYSVESNPIETLPKGLPNPPEITSIQPISNTSVAITWLPPTQPNGRLVAYILKLQKVLNGHAIIKEIPIAQNPRGYTFSGLEPMTNYSLAISAQNLEGEGRPANIQFVTPQSSMSNEVSKLPEPQLLLQGGRDIYLQNLDLFIDPDVSIFSPKQNITAMGAHYKYKWVFVATSDGLIRRVGLDGNESAVTVVTQERLDLTVDFLSVDWLNNKLYIVGKKKRSSSWTIKRCDLNGDRLVTIYSFIATKPIDFAADPFSGYLYWVIPSASPTRGGLYKLDLIPDDYLNTPVPILVYESDHLGPFTLDVANYRILIVHKARNTILSVSLDGDEANIRRNTQSPQFTEVESLATFSGLFYWTTADSVVIEEYNSAQDSYYHNGFDVPKLHQPLGGLLIVHPDLQPTPVPMATPQKVEVLFGQRRARLAWSPPPTISGLGEYAWKEWKYQIRVSDNRSISNITGNEFIIQDLRPSTFYTVQISAYTSSGRGPLSSPMRGKTLRETPYNITILWASVSGLYSTNPIGEDVQLLTTYPTEKMGTSFGNTFGSTQLQNHYQAMNIKQGSGWSPDFSSTNYIWSLTSYESSVFFALSNGSVYFYESPELLGSFPVVKPLKDGNLPPKVYPMKGISSAQSLVYDYIGQKLYWSNPKQQRISRCSFSLSPGTETNQLLNCGMKDRVERLQLVTMARELAVDSNKGLLLWSTGHSLEMSRMNGYSHGTLYQTGLFSGNQIMGITLDTEQSRIYWITRSSLGSSLQRLTYNIRGAQIPIVVANFEDVSITGPIRYFNDRLIWLQGAGEAVVTDPFGQGRSTLKVRTLDNITNLHVQDQSSMRFPTGYTKHKIQVIPNPVMEWQVVIGGRWNNFTISWDPVNNTNYGKILYEIVVNNSLSRITSYPNITIENSTMFKPYSEIEVSITSLTYWATAKPAICHLKTPSWKPSEPLNPRVFIQTLSYPYLPQEEPSGRPLSWSKNSSIIVAEFRWDAPINSNGLVQGYLTHCWKGSVKKTDCHCQIDLEQLSCKFYNLSPQSEYHFAVEAYTDSGVGKLSNKVLANTEYNRPLPMLLLGFSDKLQLLDVDRNHLKRLNLGYVNPISASFLASDRTIFWFNEGVDLMKVSVNSNGSSYNKSRILSLGDSSEASNIVVDWISRTLFWSCEHTSDSEAEFKYSIMSLDLTSFGVVDSNVKPVTISNSKTPIKSLAVNPWRNSLYWTTSRRNGITTLFTADEEGNSVRTFLSRDIEICNCSTLSSTGEPVAFDPYGLGSIERGLLFVDHEKIWLSDENGCHCIPVVNISNSGGQGGVRRGFEPPYKVAADEAHVYWAGGYLHASDKSSIGSGAAELVTSGIRDVLPFSSNAQPFPELECLLPQSLEPLKFSLFNYSSHSLYLSLPSARAKNCTVKDLSWPSSLYEVYYGTVDIDGISKCTPESPVHCKVVKTKNKTLHIIGLYPYTTYTVFVTMTNFYAVKEKMKPLISSPIVLRTAPGAPMPPKLLRLEPLRPISVRVVWGQPEKLNGEKVWYEVNWKKTDSRSPKPIGQIWAATESRSNQNKTEFLFDLGDLVPSSNYTIWVVAYSEKGDAFSASITQTVMTFPNPSNITLIGATPHNLTLEWTSPTQAGVILSHQIMYRDGWSSVWNYTPIVNHSSEQNNYSYSYEIKNLRPKTLYGFRIKTWYVGDPQKAYIWPVEDQFSFDTLTDKPGRPSQPIARGIGKALYEISWEKADDNGGTIEFYCLEYKADTVTYEVETGNGTVSSLNPNESVSQLNKEVKNGEKSRRKREWSEGSSDFKGKQISTGVTKRIIQPQWVVVYNGTNNRWEVEGLSLEGSYSFRVRAKNIYGWGDYSEESGVVSLAALTLIAEPQTAGIIVGTILLAFIILGAFSILFILLYRRKLKEKPSLQNSLSSDRRELELATLRELPGGSSFVHQSNILYAGSEILIDFELAGVCTVEWRHITVTKFLGSGAFGEVYEGIAANLGGTGVPETRVAIKTLKKGASHNEKLEFIQEAKFMSQFKHPHIIKLLGICVDNDPYCLLLELMEGGDLLSYLRSNRPHLGSTTPLTLVDLLNICVDVARGCVCLEEMHFVHRDIAARNCLVRVEEPQVNEEDSGTDEVFSRTQRIVKIGDFGLARDIYRNDYYRKEAEGGLLPVRWLPPESLVDGVFTTQTDVWAFGVLLWEIMTLGQQPYPARSNLEVLHYVRAGGQLQTPPRCPTVLGNLMLQCWEYNPTHRPSFKECLSQLELILENFQDVAIFEEIPPLNYMSFDPYSYSEGGSETKSLQYGQSQFPDPDSVFLTPTSPDDLTPIPTNARSRGRIHFPKYLEVLSDSNSEISPLPSFTATEEGYEIPLPKKPPRGPNNTTNTSSFGAFVPILQEKDDAGLPSPTYWNAETLPLQHRRQNGDRQLTSQDFGPNCGRNKKEAPYRNLLASSTSEDADAEGEGEDPDTPKCSISEHHYFPNVNKKSLYSSGINNNNDSVSTSSFHLRGVPCSATRTDATTTGNRRKNKDSFPTYVQPEPNPASAPFFPTNYNNHSYAAYSLNSVPATGNESTYPAAPAYNNNNNTKATSKRQYQPQRPQPSITESITDSKSEATATITSSPFSQTSLENNPINSLLLTGSSHNTNSNYSSQFPRSCVNAINSG